jgi:uncharacterized protein YkwD
MNTKRSTPRIARLGAMVVVLVAILAGCLNPQQEEGLNRLNGDRRAHGLRSVQTHSQLQRKAQAWAEKLARENRLYHSRLTDGVSARWCSLGENVGYGGSIASIEKAYMNSPGHRANILNGKFTHAGVGVARNGNRIFTVQVFMQSC